MAFLRVTTDDELDEHFEGVMIDVEEPFIGSVRVPGWKCRHCGWTVGTIDYPPSHDCPGIERGMLMNEFIIPHEELKRLSEIYDLSHVIMFAHERSRTVDHIVTYGDSVKNADQAAEFGNRLKDAMGWPESLRQQSAQVTERIVTLEAELRDLRQASAILASYIPDIDEDRGVVELRVNGVVREWTPDLYDALVTLCRESKHDRQT